MIRLLLDNDTTDVVIAAAAASLQQYEQLQITPQRPCNPVLRCGPTAFTLAHTIEVSTFIADGLWVYKSIVLGIESFGESKLEARESFTEDFAALYDHIANEDDTQLTPEARRIKRAFRDLVVSVYKTG